MSQLSATARVAGRPHIQARAPQRGALRVIRGTVERPRGGVFAAICLAVLVSGFLAVLVLNTAMAKGAFVLDDLEGQSGQLTDTQTVLQHAVDAESAPAMLAQRALKLGMVPSASAAFLDLSTGKVLGVAQPAAKDPGFTVVTSPVPVAPVVTPVPAKPTTTVTHKGTVTTTTVVTTKANGVVETTVTSVDSATGTTTTTTTTKVAPPVVKPGATPTAAATATVTPTPGATPTGTPTTTR